MTLHDGRMDDDRSWPLCVTALAAWAAAHAAQGKPSLSEEAQAADAMVDELDSWKKVHVAFRKYGQGAGSDP
jgi:hypothetical protein